MGKQYLDRTGVRYGRLIAISPLKSYYSTGRAKWDWVCACDCGGSKTVCATSLATGSTSSCGCLRTENAMAAQKIAHEKTHCESGKNKTDIYKLYHGMRTRVISRKPCTAKYYLDKNISVCKEWRKDYLKFKQWCLDNGYKKGLLIDRINNDRNYSPKNCRFVTPKQSARNTSANRYLQYKGKSKTIAEWIEISNINGNTFRARLRYGWSIEKILTTPVSS